MAPLRTASLALLLGCAGAALLPSHKAEAWWVRGGYGYYGPRVAYAPAPIYVAPPVYGPYRLVWFAAHYDRWGRWHPGHWG